MAPIVAAAPPPSGPDDELGDIIVAYIETRLGDHNWQLIVERFAAVYRDVALPSPSDEMVAKAAHYINFIYHLMKRHPALSIDMYINAALFYLDPIRSNFDEQYEPEPEWTELEIFIWCNSLDTTTRSNIKQFVQVAQDRGASKEYIHRRLCEHRRELEEIQAEIEAENSISLLDIIHSWNEQGRLINQDYAAREAREYFARENKKARGW